MNMRCGIASAAALAAAAGLARAQLAESFNNVPNLAATGWFTQNNTSPIGTRSWFQGNVSEFGPQATAGYLGVNYESASAIQIATISNWMVTPQLQLEDGKQFVFWTRTVSAPVYPDRLQVRMSLAGASTNVGVAATDVGDFTTLLLDINPTYLTSGYPNAWTQYTLTLSGLGVPTNGRIAFRYFVENGGIQGTNSDYIGIDEVTYNGAIVPTDTGACCLPNGSCQIVNTIVCTGQNGVYQGNNVLCNQVQCPQPGRCCLADGACSVIQPAACAAMGGTFGGAGSACGGCPQPTCYSSAGLNVPIVSPVTGGISGPDADAVLNVAASSTISTLIARVRVAHPYQGDVRIRLRHPDGTTMDLLTRPGVLPPKLTNASEFGFDTDNFGNAGTGAYLSFVDSAGTVYDDAAGFPGPPAGTATATDNVSGTFKAHGGSINSTFGGKNINGAWHFIGNDYYPGDDGAIQAVSICVPGAGLACYANCDGSTIQPCLNVQDFGCFLNRFSSGDSYANCDNSTVAPILNIQDFGCFLNKFGSGCSSC